ncbi:MAG TPA: RsmB/NOP family class I SAM-dependent RNA methyltransferase [Opitutaceae bacterium]|nr:RsmB/NOP family class I SAM-dependent RNA methyltransferase [Opitutaceae bacterium]
MSQSLITNHAAKVISSLAPDERVDTALKRHLADQRHPSPSEKGDIARAVFTYFRWFQWLDENTSVQMRVEAALDLQGRFNRDPRSTKDQALVIRAVPSWVAAEMDVSAAWCRHLQQAPALWIRARPGKAAELAKKLSDTVATPLSADALHYTGSRDLFLTPEFHAGAFELQDLSSQLVGIAAAPQPGQTWWDACAGEGGKTLHLADLMQNKGLIWASDRSERRLQSLKRRTARAKIFNYRAASWDGSERLPTKTKFDGVLIDAPCSGIGTWQRNPSARWTTTANDVKELAVIQRSLLSNVAPSLKSGGRLVYAVCTLSRAETTAVADEFTAAHPEFESMPVLGETPKKTIWPQDVNANGMFIAIWRKK